MESLKLFSMQRRPTMRCSELLRASRWLLLTREMSMAIAATNKSPLTLTQWAGAAFSTIGIIATLAAVIFVAPHLGWFAAVIVLPAPLVAAFFVFAFGASLGFTSARVTFWVALVSVLPPLACIPGLDELIIPFLVGVFLSFLLFRLAALQREREESGVVNNPYQRRISRIAISIILVGYGGLVLLGILLLHGGYHGP